MAEDGAASETDFNPKPLGALFDTPDARHVDRDDAGTGVQDEPSKDGKTEETRTTESKDAGEAKGVEGTGVMDGSPPSDDTNEDDTKLVPLSVVHGERDRRKVAEAELTALKSATPTPEAEAPQAAPKLAIPSVYDGEGQFREGVADFVKATIRQENFNERLASSQTKAMTEHGEDKVQKALDRMTPEMAKNPKYVERFRAATEPFMEIVAMAEDLDKAEKLADPDYVSKWEQQEREKIEASVRAEYEGKSQAESYLDNTIPDSLAGSRSSGDLKTGTAYSGPKPLSEIVDT